jgi:hypothetical protein
MNWAGLLLSIVLFAGIIINRNKYIESEGRLVYGVYSLAAMVLFAASLTLNEQILTGSAVNSPTAQSILEWGRMIGVALLMSGLIILIREAKPSITRFPVAFCWLPLILIPVYALVMNSVFLKEILVGFYEGGTLLAALLMYSLLLGRQAKYLFTVIGIVLLIFGFVLYWIFRIGDYPLHTIEYSWIFQLFLAWGAGITVFGISKH